MIERMDEGRGQSKCGEQAHVACLEQDGQPDAGKNQSDILNRGVSQQALHVCLDCRKDCTVQSREDAECKDCDSPSPELNVKQIEGNSQQPVNCCLEHQTAHHGRDR